MPVANKPAKQKNGQPKKTSGPHTDATAPIPREDTTPAKDGSHRGRLPGTKNKASQLLEDAQAIIAEKFQIQNWHPVIHMMIVAADETKDEVLRLNAAAKAAPYVATQLKAVELTGAEGGPVQVDLTDAKARLAAMAGLDTEEAQPANG